MIRDPDTSNTLLDSVERFVRERFVPRMDQVRECATAAALLRFTAKNGRLELNLCRVRAATSEIPLLTADSVLTYSSGERWGIGYAFDVDSGEKPDSS